MRTTAATLLAVFLGCQAAPPPPAAPIPPIVPESPPPLPERGINMAHVDGRVVDVTGLPVDGPRVTVWAAGADCVAQGSPVVVTGGVGGEFSMAVERGTGPEEPGCVVIEARVGGVATRLTRPVLFASGDPAAHNSVDLRIRLPRAPALAGEEGERLIRLLVDAIHGVDDSAIDELDLYVRGDRSRLQASLDAHRSYLRKIEAIEFAGSEGTQWMRWRLTGVAGRQATTAVYGETLIELHGALIDYAPRAAALVRRILEAAHQGDPAVMARVLTADDEHVRIDTAQGLIDHLRERFDLPRATAVLVGVDDAGNSLRYRVSGPSRTGEINEEVLTIGYGDGLVGLRGL